MPLTSIIHRIGHIPPYTATLIHIARFIGVTGLAVRIVDAFDKLAGRHFSIGIVSINRSQQITRIVGTAHFRPSLISIRENGNPLLSNNLLQLFFLTTTGKCFYAIQMTDVFIGLVRINFIIIHRCLDTFQIKSFSSFIHQ